MKRLERPDVLVVRSEDFDLDEWAGLNPLGELANETGCFVIAVPSGEVEALTFAQAKEALQAIIDREEAE